jgi:RHS repeat-associated protein
VIKDNLLLLYDGWNLLAELNQTNRAIIRSYAWGLDLANALPGDPEGAGGIGGLVHVESHVTPVGSHFPAYDGNGNVMALVDTAGALSARYEYGPFGEPIAVWGTAARLNPFRWSTKQTDKETDLVYYGYRYYSPSLGRWINRDPIEEEDARNLYRFVGNNATSGVDPDGRFLIDFLIATVADEATAKAAEAASKISYVQKVRAAVQNMGNLRMFMDGIDEANDNAFIDMITEINQLQAQAAAGLSGARSWANEEHHLTPKAKTLREFFSLADINPNRFAVDTPKWQHSAVHDRGPGGSGNGGPWNEIWSAAKEQARRSQDPRWKSKYFVSGVALGLAMKITGLDFDSVHKYRSRR